MTIHNFIWHAKPVTQLPRVPRMQETPEPLSNHNNWPKPNDLVILSKYHYKILYIVKRENKNSRQL